MTTIMLSSYLCHVSDGLHSIRLLSNTSAILGIVRHTPMLNHTQHQRLKLGVEVAVRDLADVGAHGLSVAGLGQLALRDTVEGGPALGVASTGHHLAQTVASDAGGDAEELRVAHHPVEILANPGGSNVQSQQHCGAGKDHKIAADTHL